MGIDTPQPIVITEDISAGVLGRGFPGGGLENVTVGHVHETIGTFVVTVDITNDKFDVPTTLNRGNRGLWEIGELGIHVIGHDFITALKKGNEFRGIDSDHGILRG